MPKNQRPIRKGGGHQRHISVRAVHRDPPDLRKLSRALIALAIAQAEKEAQAEAEAGTTPAPATDATRDAEASS
jgi:hypothetical protein